LLTQEQQLPTIRNIHSVQLSKSANIGLSIMP
jgi:hypothetical protein